MVAAKVVDKARGLDGLTYAASETSPSMEAYEQLAGAYQEIEATGLPLSTGKYTTWRSWRKTPSLKDLQIMVLLQGSGSPQMDA